MNSYLKMALLVLCHHLFIMAEIYAQRSGIFNLTGEIKNSKVSYLCVLRYKIDSVEHADSARSSNGRFFFKGHIKEPVVALLSIKDAQQERVSHDFFLDTGRVSVSIDSRLLSVKIRGSHSNEEFEILKKRLLPNNFSLDSLRLVAKQVRKSKQLTDDGKQLKIAELNRQYDSVDEEKNPIYNSFVEGFPDSYVSVYALEQYHRYFINTREARKTIGRFSNKIKQSIELSQFVKQIERAEITDPGKPALYFSLPDTVGNIVHLADFKNKVLLIDFWASWCPPCRAQNPDLIALYKTFHSKGFEIIGISLDDDKNAWQKAITKDGLNWPQLSDLRAFENAVAKQYNIGSIPQNIIVDQRGLIVGKNVKIGQLKTMLQEILK